MNLIESLEQRRMLAFGDFDTNFGSGGHLAAGAAGATYQTKTGGDNLLVLPDGHIVFTSGDLVERKADGSLATAFGDNGIARLPDGWTTNHAVKLTANGFLYVDAVNTTTGESGFARFNLSGALDTSYGQNGIAKTPDSADPQAAYFINQWVATRGGTVFYLNSDGALARVFSSGRADPNFRILGAVPAPPQKSRIHLDFNSAKPKLLIDSDDRLRLVATTDWERTDVSQDSDGDPQFTTTVFSRFVSVTALNTLGHIDRSFGISGVTYIPMARAQIPDYDAVDATATIQPGTDKILIAVLDARTDLIELNSNGRAISASVPYDGPVENYPGAMQWLADGRVVAITDEYRSTSPTLGIAIIAPGADGKWQVGPLISPEYPPVETSTMSSLAVTPNGKILVGGDWELNIGTTDHPDDVHFQLEQIDAGAANDPAAVNHVIAGGRENVAAVDSEGGLHIAYFNANDRELELTSRDPTSRWSAAPTVVDASTNDIRDLTMVIDPDSDNPAIVYFDAENIQLKFAATDSVAGGVDTLVSDDVIEHPSLIFGDNHSPWIAYYDRTAGELRLAHRTGQYDDLNQPIWNIETVDHVAANEPNGVWSSIAVNSDTNRFAIAYSTPAGIKLAERQKGGGWQISNVTGSASATADLHLAYVDVPNVGGTFATIAYRDATHSDARYAARSSDTSQWSTDIVSGKSIASDNFTRVTSLDQFGQVQGEGQLYWWNAKHNVVQFLSIDEIGGFAQIDRNEHAAYGGGQFLSVAGNALIYLDSASGNLIVTQFG